MRVYIDLASGLDTEVWRERHARDEVPDASPYGLHRLEEYGLDVTFRPPPSGDGGPGARVRSRSRARCTTERAASN